MNQKPKHRQASVKLFVIALLFWFSLYVYVPYQTVYLNSKGILPTVLGLTLGAYGYAQFIMRLPLGIFVDRLKREKIILLAGTLFPVLASVYRLFGEGQWAFLLANLLSGMGAATWVVFMVEFSKRMPERSLRENTALANAANQSGILIGFVFSMLSYEFGQMQLLLYASVSAGLVATLLLLTLKDRDELIKRDEKAEIQRSTPLLVLRSKRVWLYSVFGLIHIGLIHATVQAFSTQFMRNIGGSNLAVGLMNVIFMGFTVLVSFFAASPFMQHLGAKKVLTLSHLIMAVYCFVSPHLKIVWGLLFLQALAGVYNGLVAPFAIAEAMKNTKLSNYNTAMAVYQMSVGLGISIMPAITGSLIARFNPQISYTILGTLSLLMVAYAILLGNYQWREEHSITV